MKYLLLAVLAALAVITSGFPLVESGDSSCGSSPGPSSSGSSASSASSSSSGGSNRSSTSGSGSGSSGGSSCSGSPSSSSSSSSGSDTQPLSPIQKITSAGNVRSFFYYQPANFDASIGMLLALHGGGGSGYSFAKGSSQSLWLDLADRTGLLVLFPNGKPRPGDPQKRNWNTCMQDSDTSSPTYNDWDDVQFMRDLVPWVTANIGGVDTSRVYAAGESEGGWLTQRLALEANDLIAAGADFAANLPVSNDDGTYKCTGYTAPYTPGTQVPLLLFKGNADPRLSYGAKSGPDPTQYCSSSDSSGTTAPCAKGAFYSFYSTVAFWQWKLGISDDKTTQVAATSTTPYADTVPDCTSSVGSCDGSTVTRYEFGSSPAPLVFDLVDGGGHRFPGPNAETHAQLSSLGWQNRDSLGQANPYAAEEAWAFLSQFSR